MLWTCRVDSARLGVLPRKTAGQGRDAEMRELSPETITDAVLDQMATTADPRLKEIMASRSSTFMPSPGTSI